jgi:hypothetical protein
LIALLATALAAPVLAQQAPPLPPAQVQPGAQAPQNPPTGRGAGRGQGQQAPAPAGQSGRGGVPGGVPRGVPGGVAGRWEPPSQNIRLDVTISDSAEKTMKKVVSMLVADRDSGRIRSANRTGQVLNVDGRGEVAADGRVYVALTIEYQPEGTPNTTMLNQSISLVLAAGRPTVISQSADPNTDRKVTVEVTATVVK